MKASLSLPHTITGDSLKTIRNVILRKACYCGEGTGDTTQDSAVFFSWKETTGYKRAIQRSERSAPAAAHSGAGRVSSNNKVPCKLSPAATSTVISTSMVKTREFLENTFYPPSAKPDHQYRASVVRGSVWTSPPKFRVTASF